MEYSKIVAITGLPGLYELVISKTDGAIVRSLEDKSTRFVSSRIHNFSHLESIEVFTSKENVNLAEVLKAMDGSSEKLPEEKDTAALNLYFKKIYPELDFDRVYNSDLRKMVKWFSVLKMNQVDFTLPAAPETPAEEEIEERPVPVKTEPIPAAEKTVKKKKEAVTDKEPPDKKTEKKPPKAKPAKKEKKEVKEKAVKKEKPAKKAAKKKK